MPIEMPSPVFISHSYRDAHELALARRLLPSNVEVLIHPPISVAPNEFVSDSLVSMIEQAASGLVVDGPGARQSFWVAFERDFMARARTPLFQMTGDKIKPLSVEPPRLPIYLSYASPNRPQAQAIASFMRERRNFDLWMDRNHGPVAAARYPASDGTRRLGDWQKEQEFAFRDRLEDDGYAVFLLSTAFAERPLLTRALLDALAKRPNSAVLVYIEDHHRVIRSLPDPVLRHVLTPSDDPTHIREARVLDLSVGIESGLNANILDSLMVSLLHRVYLAKGSISV